MKHIERPDQITTILKTIHSGDDPAISAELEAYIAALEAKQPDRPARIAAILETISSEYPADVEISLETYISDLEAKQRAVLSSNNHTPSWDPNNPPIWSQQRHNEREQHRRQHALRKQHDYR
jgi:hypothetical protein